jgi:hypothetical protein
MLGPDDAVDGFAGRVPDGASGEGLLVGLGLTLVALGHPLHRIDKMLSSFRPNQSGQRQCFEIRIKALPKLKVNFTFFVLNSN